MPVGRKGQEGAADPHRDVPLARWFALGFGAFLGLALIKFGNPPIMEKWVTRPGDVYEFMLGSPWPISWAYGFLAVLGVAGLFAAKWKVGVPRWLLAMPVAWLIWECVAAGWTVNAELTRFTLAHLFACVVCFYLGLFSLDNGRRMVWLLPGLLCGFLIVIVVGWQQHFGGLEQSRRYFFLYIYPRLKEVPHDYLKKLSSTRIFSTLFYPNALAGATLLLLPALLEFLWQARKRFTQAARLFLVTAIGIGALGCLYWSGSKGGWLLMLALGLVWLLRLPFNPKLKQALLALLLVGGLAGFFFRYAGFFHKGATSVEARFDYWHAAVQTTVAHPLVGTGPGTFSTAYQRVKRPEWEMSRLVHNDYLEQASDSGLPGFVFYSAFILGTLLITAPSFKRPGDATLSPSRAQGKSTAGESKIQGRADSASVPAIDQANGGIETPISFAIWLGILGWALQSTMEFGLYIPGLAWPAFAFLGALLGRRGGLLKTEP